jgi:hypothetical protein
MTSFSRPQIMIATIDVIHRITVIKPMIFLKECTLE